ncbi:MAG: hypothetical protein DRJ09_12470 [Bacteroidetes bacterium]|nr:MAG: hypothetical protein DRJ09_12470 [Bacteroidota bacterium]
MKKAVLFLLFVLVANQFFAQETKLSQSIDFNGYIQLRGITDFDNYTSFSVRRLKLWVKSKPGFSEYWSYKIQTTFSSFLQEKFFLQDVKIGYKTGRFSFDIGQFVPQYSLQRFQHDYILGPVERTKAVNVLIPDGTLGVRDIGLQINFITKNKFFETHLGLFNGYGIKEYRFKNSGYMFTHKSAVNIPIKKHLVKLGYSLQYRKAEDLQLHFILPDSVLFSGNDFRFNLFAMFKSKLIKLQAEYLNANLDGSKAYGYYFLSVINISKHQIVLSVEDYKDLIQETSDKPNYRIGYNYLIKDYKIKISLDNYFRLNSGKIENYYASLQLQLFLK